MATQMSKQLADIYAAIADDRQRMVEAQTHPRLSRAAAENAIDLSRAIYVQEIMVIQNNDIVDRLLAGLIGVIDNFLNAADDKTDTSIPCRFCKHTLRCHIALTDNDSSDPECEAKGTPCAIFESATATPTQEADDARR